MKLTKNDIKRIIQEKISEARIYGDPLRTSDEYELTPEEVANLKTMTYQQRMMFASKKIKQARRKKGQCIAGGPNCDPPIRKPDGTLGIYCKKHLESYRAARQRLIKARNSCVRCPNPPRPGKKLCQKCADEIDAIRNKAISAGLCMRCKKVPAEPPTKFCKACMIAKVERNKQLKMMKRGWRDYAKDIERSARERRISNLGIQETSGLQFS
jgi:hypothetical protein